MGEPQGPLNTLQAHRGGSRALGSPGRRAAGVAPAVQGESHESAVRPFWILCTCIIL